MKRFFALLLSTIMLLSFAACSNSDSDKADDGTTGSSGGSTTPSTQAPKEHTIEMFVKEAMEMEYCGKTEYVKGSVPQEVWDWYESEHGVTYDSVITSYEEYQARRQETDEYTYGTNFTMTYTIDKIDPLPENITVEEIATALAEYHAGVDPSKVTDVKELVITQTLSGDKDTDTGSFGFTVVQYDGRWYSLVYTKQYDGQVYANFSSTAFR